MSVSGRQYDRNSGVRKVVLTTGPILHPLSKASNASKNYYCLALDMKGFQIQVDLQAIPAGVNLNQIEVNQVWWVEKRTTLYRLYLYSGIMDPVTRQIDTTVSIQSALNNVAISGTPSAGQALVATSSSGATWSTISGGTTVSGNFLPISGGTISGNLTVTGTTTLQGGLYVTSPLVGGVTATSGQSLVYNGTQWAPATVSGGTVSGNYLPISGGTITGNLVVASGLTVTGTSTLANYTTISSNGTSGYISINGIGGTLSVYGLTSTAGTFSSSLITNGALFVGGNATISGSVTATGIQITESQVTGLSTDLTNISGSLSTLSGNLSTLSGQYVSTSGSLTTLSGQYVSTSGSLTTLSGQFVSLSGAYAATSGSLNTVSGVAYAALPRSGGTISGNLIVASGLTVSGTVTATGIQKRSYC